MNLEKKILNKIEIYEELVGRAEKHMEDFSYSPELKSYYEGKVQAYRYAIVDFKMLLDLAGEIDD